MGPPALQASSLSMVKSTDGRRMIKLFPALLGSQHLLQTAIMGAQNSNLRNNLHEEFDRVCKGSKGHLALDDLMGLHVDRISTNPWLLDPLHLGVLWVLDR